MYLLCSTDEYLPAGIGTLGGLRDEHLPAGVGTLGGLRDEHRQVARVADHLQGGYHDIFFHKTEHCHQLYCLYRS